MNTTTSSRQPICGVSTKPRSSRPRCDPRGEPVFGFDVTVYPARTSGLGDQPPKVNWGSTGSVPAADTALFAETLTLASRLAMYASLGETRAAPGARAPDSQLALRGNPRARRSCPGAAALLPALLHPPQPQPSPELTLP
jgi:hypothetical protein